MTQSLATYFVLAYVISWSLWLPVALLFPDNAAPPWWALLLAFAGGYGPSMAAMATAAIHGGRTELRKLLTRSWNWRVGWRWYALVLFGPPAFLWIGALLHALLGGHVRVAGLHSITRAAVVLATFIPFGPLGEELGWRGYALPRLERHLSPLVSSLALGIIWAAWHAPAFWIAPAGMPKRCVSTAVLWAAYTISFSILLSYVARRTNYSVPIAILLHATLNAGSAMGFATLTAAPPDLQAVGAWAQRMHWLAVFACAGSLVRDARAVARGSDTSDISG